MTPTWLDHEQAESPETVFMARPPNAERVAGDNEVLKDEFLAILSHELRTPLATIKGFVDLLVADDTSNLTETQREFLTIVALNAQREVEIIDQLLEYAQVRAGRVALNLTALHIPTLLERCSGSPDAGTSTRRCTVSLTCEAQLPHVLADGERVRQILDAMLDFAEDRIMAGDHVRVMAGTEPGGVCISVQDSGPAVSLPQHDQLFSGFHQIVGDTRPGDRLGLNLAIARGLARSLGGDLSLRYSDGPGATLCLTLPLLNAALDPGGSAITTAPRLAEVDHLAYASEPV